MSSPLHGLRDPETLPGRPVCLLHSTDLKAPTSLEGWLCSHIHLSPSHTLPLVGTPPAASSSLPSPPFTWWYLRGGSVLPSLGVHVSTPQQGLELPCQEEGLVQFPSSLAET